MTIDTFRAGWSPTPESVPRPRFDVALRPEAVALPEKVDYFSQVRTVGMHLNDQWGCCTCSGDANIVQGVTAYGSGTEVVVPDSDVLKAYEKSGFNPKDGAPGSNPTDQGWTCGDALAYLKHTGMAGKKIAAYGQVSYTDHAKVMTCLYEFGYASLGVNLPQSAMDQFNEGKPWTVSGNSSILGGHCIIACGYTPTGPMIWTWGKPVQVSWSWFDTYTSECWPVVSLDWVSAASAKDPAGVDKAVLASEWETAVGQNPFVPSPDPSGNPGCLSAIAAIARRIRG